MSVDVVIPESEGEAVTAYGDGSDITVMGGGTIVMQLLNYQRLKPSRILLLTKSGMDHIKQNGEATITIGATTSLSDLTDLVDPIGACALNVADAEIRGQATLGGNLCSPTPPEHPSGDLQGALIAVGATVRSAGAGGESLDSVEDFLPNRAGRLVLDVSFEPPSSGAFAAFRRPHAHHFTPLAVSGATDSGGVLRLAVTGAGDTAARLPSAEAAADDPAAAGDAALSDVTMTDDAIISGWYRERLLPTLVRRVLDDMKDKS